MQLAKGNAPWASEGLDFRQKGIYAAGYRDCTRGRCREEKGKRHDGVQYAA
jgi:hypothetical protein